MKQPIFFTYWYQKSRVDRKILGWVWSEMVVAHWSQDEWMNGWMNWADVLHTDVNSRKLRTTLMISGWLWYKKGMELFFQMHEWTKLMFCMLHMFKRAKSYFNSYWAAMVKYGMSFWVMRLNNLLSLKNELNKLSWFFACWNWCI